MLKINASIINIELRFNKIGIEGAKAWCGVGSAENVSDSAACHDFMSSASCDSVTSLDGWGVLQFDHSSLIESCPTCTVAAAQELR